MKEDSDIYVSTVVARSASSLGIRKPQTTCGIGTPPLFLLVVMVVALAAAAAAAVGV